MKKILLFFALAACLPAFSQSMKMVVDNQGNVVGRYVRTSGQSYIISIQDEGDVPVSGHKVVTYSAEKGQGILYIKNPGTVNVRSTPSTKGKIVTKISYEEGYMPDVYDCLGKVNGWYKLSVDGKVGYVRADLLEWDGMCSF